MLRRIAEFSNAETLVWGQYAKVGDQIRIDATLEDMKRQRITTTQGCRADGKRNCCKQCSSFAESVQQNLALSGDVLKELRAKSLKPSSPILGRPPVLPRRNRAGAPGKSSGGRKAFRGCSAGGPRVRLGLFEVRANVQQSSKMTIKRSSFPGKPWT